MPSENLEKYLERNNKIIIGTTPPTKDSTFIKPSLDDEFFKKFATFKNEKLALLTVGTYTDKNVGYACYHSQLGSAVLIYNRLLDNDKLIVITDSTAGVDSVGTSMFCVSDINVFVVEPTKKSIDVYKDFVEITKKYKITNYVIGNKVRNQDDIEFIKSQIDEKNILGFVADSEYLRKYEQGNEEEFNNFVLNNNEINEKIFELLKSTKKDWNNYYEIQKQVYKDDCAEWYSQFYNKDLTEYIDPEFNYEEVIRCLNLHQN